MSPYILQMLLHFYYCLDSFHGSDSRAYSEGLRYLLTLQVIKSIDNHAKYTVTPKGAAWVRTILKTPTPQVAHIDQQGRVIE